MCVVITGGCGFLGRRLAMRLLERSDIEELVLFDNAPSAMPLPEDKRLTVTTGDIADRETVRRAITPGPASVVHLPAGVRREGDAGRQPRYRATRHRPRPRLA